MSGGEEARIFAVFAKPTMGWVEFCAVTIELLVNPVSAASATSTYGGDCHNYALLAAGHVDIVLEDGLATHDIMGVVEVIRAAGGIVTDKTGAAVTMQGTDSLLAASTLELHAAALALAGKSG